jgi:hypothetical protein
MGECRPKKKPPEGGIFFEAEKITSSLQQEQQQEQQLGLQQVQQEQQQGLQQQQGQQQVQPLLFYRKQPEQQPTKLPRGVTFSWKFPLSDAKTLQELPQALI